jgi:hypothetical protein
LIRPFGLHRAAHIPPYLTLLVIDFIFDFFIERENFSRAIERGVDNVLKGLVTFDIEEANSCARVSQLGD